MIAATCSSIFPAGAELVTGQTLTQPITLSSDFTLPESFFDGQIVKVDIGLGPMNARGVLVAEPL
ncbi:MAG: hypothetical protein O9257_06360 [Brevundimonas sp.]|jgi:hypothetical protein|uniref:hypothetical protein n=1 Tax=Brevundimonas sp. TaxID=1871086 RepID=UPI0022BD34AF|nr:hypothetical protein [Brevundimonas sp.]